MLSSDPASDVILSLIQLLTRTVLFSSCNHFDMIKYQSKEGTLQTIFKIGKPVTAVPKKLSPDFSYLIYLSFTPPNIQFVQRQIDAIHGDTVDKIRRHTNIVI